MTKFHLLPFLENTQVRASQSLEFWHGPRLAASARFHLAIALVLTKRRLGSSQVTLECRRNHSVSSH